MAQAIGKAQRINLVAAIEHIVGQARAAQEHAQHRAAADLPIRQGDKLPRDDMIVHARFGDGHDPLQRLDRVAMDAQVQRDQVGLAIGQHRDRRHPAFEMLALIEFGQRCLYCPVAAIDDDDDRIDAGDGLERPADLFDMLHFIMEDVGVARAIAAHARKRLPVARGFGIGQEGDANHGFGVTYI